MDITERWSTHTPRALPLDPHLVPHPMTDGRNSKVVQQKRSIYRGQTVSAHTQCHTNKSLVTKAQSLCLLGQYIRQDMVRTRPPSQIGIT